MNNSEMSVGLCIDASSKCSHRLIWVFITERKWIKLNALNDISKQAIRAREKRKKENEIKKIRQLIKSTYFWSTT